MVKFASKNMALALIVLSLTACQTTGGVNKDEILFSGISEYKSSAETPAKIRKAEDPVCVKFYANATQYVAKPDAKNMGKSLLKTVALGAIAGAASGGVSSLGIGSSFLEIALSGAANQVVFQGGNAALNKVAGDDANPIQEIETAAKDVGCPAPANAAAKGTKALTKTVAK